MKWKLLLIVAIILAMAAMACRLSFNFPIDNIETGPTQVEDISLPVPDEKPAKLTLEFGAGELKLAPGAENALIKGTAKYNVMDLKPEIEVDGNEVRISIGDLEIEGIPDFDLDDMENEWDFRLSDSPMDLTIIAGAYQGKIELGDLALTSLTVSDGAADVKLDFSEPNKVEMSSFEYKTGASSVKLRGLANANFSEMRFRSGAGDYTLDFSGKLLRDTYITVQSGVSHVVIIVPEGVPAVIEFTGGLTAVEIHGGWQQRGDTYIMEGEGPGLIIEVEIGAGNLELRTR